MDNDQFAELSAWITEAGLAGQSESAILAGFCEREVARGLPLARALVLIDTLHPIYEGRAFRWTRAQKETTLTEYGRSDDDLSRWQRSPFYRLEESGEPLLRRHLTAETEPEFSIFADLRADGMTDYVAIANRFTGDEIIGRMDCVYSSWATDASQGFDDDDVADLCRLMPFLALAARRSVTLVNQRRAAKGLPITDMYLGLHIGEVFYGNIGSKDRLDFTVVGPAVNEVSRIAALCRSVEQPLLVSSTFASALGEARSRLVSVGRYALRGVGRAQDLFTLE